MTPLRSATPRRVKIVEVGARDGLQNEPVRISVADRIRLIEALALAGCQTIEAGSFVSASRVPQMADTELVLEGLARATGVAYPVLVPNLKGLDGAIRAGVDIVAIFAAATDGFSRANLNAPMEESFRRLADVAVAARSVGIAVRGSISCAIHCPYEGWVDAEGVARLARRLIDLGCHEVALCDTTGYATVNRARELIAAVTRLVGVEQLAVHFHDTYGQALANTLACIELGVGTVDSAVAGLGGCPYSPGAAGNLATEDLVYLLDGMGIETGIDLPSLAAAGREILALLGKPSQSRVGAALKKGGPSPG